MFTGDEKMNKFFSISVITLMMFSIGISTSCKPRLTQAQKQELAAAEKAYEEAKVEVDVANTLDSFAGTVDTHMGKATANMKLKSAEYKLKAVKKRLNIE